MWCVLDILFVNPKHVLISMTKVEEINDAACRIAREVADESGALVAGSIVKCPSYAEGKGKAAVQEQVRQQLQPFIKNKVDFIILEVSMLSLETYLL